MPLMHQVQVFPSCIKHNKTLNVKQCLSNMILEFSEKYKEKNMKKQKLLVTFSLNDLYQHIFGKKAIACRYE